MGGLFGLNRIVILCQAAPLVLPEVSSGGSRGEKSKGGLPKGVKFGLENIGTKSMQNNISI